MPSPLEYLQKVIQHLVDWLVEFATNLSQHEVVDPWLSMLSASQRQAMGELSLRHLQHAPPLSKSPVFNVGHLVELWLEAVRQM